MEKKNSLCEEDLQLRGGEVSTERWGSCHAGGSSHLVFPPGQTWRCPWSQQDGAVGGGRRRSDGDPSQRGGIHLGVSITSTRETFSCP